jgi:uncharacterized protein
MAYIDNATPAQPPNTAASVPPPAARAVRFAGYAALFDTPDTSGDIIRKGAFAHNLENAPKSFPLLWQHDAGKPIGTIEHLQEDARGLQVIGKLNAESRVAKEAAALLQHGGLDGLSFGYRVRGVGGDSNAPASPPTSPPRELTKLDLVEVSLVTFPMHPQARVHKIDAPSSAGA